MRKAWAAAGGGVLAVGIILTIIAALQQAAASAAAMNCFVGSPTYGFPSTCADAYSAMYLWEAVTSLSVVVAFVGLVLLILGVVLQPEGARTGPPYAPWYPPPVYAPSYPPPVYAPPQGPRTPPPGSP